MIDTYKGESVGKKMARAHLWTRLLGELRCAENEASFVVLASREGGDISTLTGIGVPIGQITAVDRCATAAAECRTRWPGANVQHGDVIDFITPSTDAVFLDFCAPICPATLETCSAVFSRLGHGALFACAFLKGRETDADLGLWDGRKPNRSQRRSIRSQGRTDRRLGQKLTAATKGMSQISGRDLIAEAGLPSQGRMVAVVSCAVTQRRLLEPLEIIFYQSATAASKGVPMIISAYRVLNVDRVDQRMLTQKTHDRINSGQITTPKKYGNDPQLLKRFVLGLLSRPGVPRDETAHVAKIYNLPHATVVAWKAHATRGTYSGAGLGIEPRGPGV